MKNWEFRGRYLAWNRKTGAPSGEKPGGRNFSGEHLVAEFCLLGLSQTLPAVRNIPVECNVSWVAGDGGHVVVPTLGVTNWLLRHGKSPGCLGSVLSWKRGHIRDSSGDFNDHVGSDKGEGYDWEELRPRSEPNWCFVIGLLCES